MTKLSESIFSPVAINCPAVVHGNVHEQLALNKFEQMTSTKVRKCGLFVNPDFPYLAASPDGVIESKNEIVEIKCPFNGRNKKIQEGKDFSFLTVEDNKLTLKKTHNYYYQIQGQMACSQKYVCQFVVFTLVDIFIEQIHFDPTFFEKEMLPKLNDFYFSIYEPLILTKM